MVLPVFSAKTGRVFFFFLSFTILRNKRVLDFFLDAKYFSCHVKPYHHQNKKVLIHFYYLPVKNQSKSDWFWSRREKKREVLAGNKVFLLTWFWYQLLDSSFSEIKTFLTVRQDMGALVSVGMGVSECQSEDSFVCFGAKPTQRSYARDFPQNRKKTKEGKVPEQSTEESNQQMSGKGDGQREMTAKRGVGTCGLKSQVSQRKRISHLSLWLCRNFARIHACDSPTKTTQKYHKLLPSYAWSLPKPMFVYSSFLPPSQLCKLCLVCL